MKPSRRIALVLLAAVVGLAGGCASTAPAEDGEPTLASSIAEPSDLVSRLTGNDNGLELRKWLIRDDPARIAAAMTEFDAVPALRDDADRRFRRNGLRFVRTPLGELPALRAALGEAPVNVQGWHGQIVQWRALHELSLGRDAGPIAIDGRYRVFDGGRLRLLARAWTVPMEDGPHVQLELVPEYLQQPRRGADLRRLLESRTGSGLREPLTSMAVDVALQPGFAYLLLYEAPQAEWIDGGADGVAAETPAGPGVGPESVTPPTLGQRMLFSDTGQPVRGVLVFVPRVPADLFPPELARSVRGDAGAGG